MKNFSLWTTKNRMKMIYPFLIYKNNFMSSSVNKTSLWSLKESFEWPNSLGVVGWFWVNFGVFHKYCSPGNISSGFTARISASGSDMRLITVKFWNSKKMVKKSGKTLMLKLCSLRSQNSYWIKFPMFEDWHALLMVPGKCPITISNVCGCADKWGAQYQGFIDCHLKQKGFLTCSFRNEISTFHLISWLAL